MLSSYQCSGTKLQNFNENMQCSETLTSASCLLVMMLIGQLRVKSKLQ